jgi:hypothetical protein
MGFRRDLTEEASGKRIVTIEIIDLPDGTIGQEAAAATESESRKRTKRLDEVRTKIRDEGGRAIRKASRLGRVRNITDASPRRRGAATYRQAPVIARARLLIERKNPFENRHQLARKERADQTEERGTVTLTNHPLMVAGTKRLLWRMARFSSERPWNRPDLKVKSANCICDRLQSIAN